MKSLWEDTVRIQRRGQAEGKLEREVVVIGAGMTGILTAWQLRKKGKQVAVLEADRIAGGQTGRTTAKITSQHGLFYSELLQNLGRERAQLYAGANEAAIAEYERIVQEREIACEFKRLPSYLYSALNETLLRREAQAAKMLGIEARFTAVRELPFLTAGAVCFEKQAQFHPLKFLCALAEELEVYEASQVKKVRGNTVYTDAAEIRTAHIVFATHYPIINFPGRYFLRQHQERSYVLGLSGCRELSGMYFSADEDGLSFRSAGEILLLGGNAHRTGKNRQGGAYGSLKAAAYKYYPKAEAVYQWSAQDCMPHDSLPLIGRYDYGERNWYVATGYQKWGMTTAMAAAMLLADLIAGTPNPYEKLFTPQRHHLFAAPKLFEDVGESIKGLSGGLAAPYEKCGSGEGQVHTRCTHLGCRLEWNADEKSWDCPCHGSRYDADGKLLDGPAQRPLRKKFPEP